MLKHLQLKLLLLLCALVAGSGTMWGDDTTVSYGWENNDDATAWTITNSIAKTSGQGNTGTYAGKINTNHTYVQFKEKVYVKSFSFAFKRTSNNSNYNVYIETSTDGSNWTAVETYTMGSFNNGSYLTKTKTFDGNNQYYVRFHCYNTTAVRYVDDVSITYSTNQANPVCVTPSIAPNGGNFIGSQEVTLACSTNDATIYYTLDGTDPTTSSTEYTAPFTITESKTVKAIAVADNMDNSNIATAEFTKITPLANIAELTTETNTNSYYVTFDNAVVTFVSGNYAYIQDASGAVVLNKSGHGLTAGDVFNGTATVSYKLNNSNPQITNISGVTPTSGIAPIPTEVAQSAWTYTFNNVLSQYFKIKGATITQNNSKYYVSLGGENIQLYKAGSSISGLNLNKTYNIIGFPTLYNTTKEIQIYSDPEEVTDPILSVDPKTATIFTYVVGNGPSDNQMFTVTGANLVSSDITATVSSDYEITDNTDYSSSVTIASDDIVSVRLKAGLAKGTHNGTLTFSSTDAADVIINLNGTVTGTTYAVNVDDNVVGGTIDADLTSAEKGATVSLTATPDAAYTFGSWTVYEDDMSTEITVTNNQFTMPACEVYVTATFNTKPTFAVTCVANPVAGGGLGASLASAYEGQTVTLSYSAETGYSLSSIVITKTSDGSAAGITPAASGDDFTFTMPGYAVTATAMFESNNFEGSFAKVTSISALEDNGYYVLYNTYAMNSTVTSGKMGATDVTINNDIIENPDKSIVWKLVKNGDNWDLYSVKEEKYCYIEGTNTSAFKMADAASYHYTVTTYETGGGFKFKSTHSDHRGIDFGSTNFGSYADSNSPTVYLYKYTTLTERIITFDGNGGTCKKGTTYTQNVYDGVETTLDANKFTRNGYEFVAWNNQANGEGNCSYTDEDVITVTGSDLTLYAQWTPLYTLTIDKNIDGGIVEIEGNLTSSVKGIDITLTATPSSGYILGEWNVYKADDPSTKVTVTNNTFIMPEYNVVISATFAVAQTYSMVTDINDLVPGKHYIIASGTNGYVKAMGSQSTNNRVAVDVIATSGIIPETEGVYEFVLYGPDASGYYTLYDEKNAKYLYAGSSSANHLKTQETNNANGKWSIEIGNEGVATIMAQGSNTRNLMRFNNTLFSCYGSGQYDIYLYVKDGDAPVAATTSVKLNASGYATFASTSAFDFLDADVADFSAWQITAINGTTGVIIFSQIKSTVAAGKGVLLKGTPNVTIELNILPAGGVTLSDNKLEGITEPTAITADTYYGLSGNKFVRVNAGTVPAGKALLPASEVSSARELTFVFEGDETTGVKTIDNGQWTIDNGQWTIDNGAIYDLQGRKVTKPVKGGLYIVNGKKVIK